MFEATDVDNTFGNRAQSPRPNNSTIFPTGKNENVNEGLMGNYPFVDGEDSLYYNGSSTTSSRLNKRETHDPESAFNTDFLEEDLGLDSNATTKGIISSLMSDPSGRNAFDLMPEDFQTGHANLYGSRLLSTAEDDDSMTGGRSLKVNSRLNSIENTLEHSTLAMQHLYVSEDDKHRLQGSEMVQPNVNTGIRRGSNSNTYLPDTLTAAKVNAPANVAHATIPPSNQPNNPTPAANVAPMVVQTNAGNAPNNVQDYRNAMPPPGTAPMNVQVIQQPHYIPVDGPGQQQAVQGYYVQPTIYVDANGQPLYYRPAQYPPEIIYTNPDGTPVADPMQLSFLHMQAHGGYWPGSNMPGVVDPSHNPNQNAAMYLQGPPGGQYDSNGMPRRVVPYHGPYGPPPMQHGHGNNQCGNPNGGNVNRLQAFPNQVAANGGQGNMGNQPTAGGAIGNNRVGEMVMDGYHNMMQVPLPPQQSGIRMDEYHGQGGEFRQPHGGAVNLPQGVSMDMLRANGGGVSPPGIMDPRYPNGYVMSPPMPGGARNQMMPNGVNNNSFEDDRQLREYYRHDMSAGGGGGGHPHGNNHRNRHDMNNSNRNNDRGNSNRNRSGNNNNNNNNGNSNNNGGNGNNNNGGGNANSNNNNGGNAAASTVRDSLVEEFRNTYGKSRQWNLHDLVGHVVAFCQDQHGSRFIQQRLEVCSDSEKQVVFDEIVPSASVLMTDVFGNYVLQKLFEFGASEQCDTLSSLLVGECVVLSMQMYGCRVVQKALEYVSTSRLVNLVTEFENPTVLLSCVHDANGNHVIQKCIEVVSKAAREATDPATAEYLNSRIQFIIDTFRNKVKELSSHPYGCRVVQRILEHCSNPQKSVILEELRQCCADLVQDCYGNYVIQFVMQHGWEADRAVLIKEVHAHLLEFSQHKFASNVVEKCLQYASKRDRDEMIWKIINLTFDTNSPIDGKGNSALETMVRDPYANYVVQKVIDVSDEKQRGAILKYVRENIAQLRRYTYGKHIILRLEKITNEKF